MSGLEERLRNIFRPNWYLKQYPDIELAGVDPWDHFISSGLSEGRAPTPLFNLDFFTPESPWKRYDGATIADYLNGLHRELPPSPLFDLEWYRSQAKTEFRNESALEHFFREGAILGYEPCPLFMSNLFRQPHHEMTAIEEYLADPLAWTAPIGFFFSGKLYYEKNPDVEEQGLQPLLHFYGSGQQSDRFEPPLIDLKLAKKLLPEALLYSDVVAALRSGTAISPVELSHDLLNQHLLTHALEVDHQRTHAHSTSHRSGKTNEQIFEDSLVVRASTVEIPAVDHPKVSVIIPTYNDSKMTIASIEAVSRSSCLHELEIVVIDDGSRSDTVAALSNIKNINLIRLAKNGGYSSAVKAGVDAAKGEFIFLHNNDAEVLPTSLQALVDTLQQDETIGAAGCLVLDANLKIQEAGCAVSVGGFGHQFGNGSSPNVGMYRYARDVDYCSAVALMLRKSTWDTVGGYTKSLEPAYYEDADLCMKITSAGQRIRFVPSAAVLHNEGASHGRGLHGSKAFQFRNRRTFAEVWSQALITKPAINNEMSASQFAQAFDLQPGDDVLIVDDKVPDITTDAGSVRMAQITTVLAGEGFNVHFVGLGGEGRSAWSYDPGQASIHWETGFKGLHRALQTIRTERPIVILSRPDVYVRALPEILEQCPDAYIVYDTVDAHGLRLGREIEMLRQQGQSTIEKTRAAIGSKRLESLAINSADCVISVSAIDTDYFRSINSEVAIVEIPMLHRPVEQPPELSGRTDILFVGGYRHPPNIDAALFAAEEIMPEVWEEFPDARLVLAGSFPPKKVRSLASQRVVVTGWLDSLDNLYSTARVSLAPLRFGAGINGKVTEALSLGIPVVTSAQSAEAADLTHEREVLIADTAESYSANIVRLFRDDGLWQSMSAAGVQKVASAYGPNVARSQIGTIKRLRGGALVDNLGSRQPE